jgi:hypothetical protein
MEIDVIGDFADRLLEAARAQSQAIQDLKELCDDYIRRNEI